LELDELLAFQQETERLITQPQRDFTQFVEACFGPFAASLAKTKDPYKSLEKEAKDLIAVLHEKLDRRRKNLQTGLGVAVRSKIKLTTFDLKVTIFLQNYILRILSIIMFVYRIVLNLSMLSRANDEGKRMKVDD
jgi:hypothetical protein